MIGAIAGTVVQSEVSLLKHVSTHTNSGNVSRSNKYAYGSDFASESFSKVSARGEPKHRRITSTMILKEKQRPELGYFRKLRVPKKTGAERINRTQNSAKVANGGDLLRLCNLYLGLPAISSRDHSLTP